MTDTPLAPSDFEIDDELVFDDIVPPPLPPPTPPKKSRGRKAPAEPADTVPALEAEPTPPPAPAPAPAPAMDFDLSMPDFGDMAPAGPAPAPAAASAPIAAAPAVPAVGRSRGYDRMLIALVTLAFLTALMSLGGLIAVGRSLSAAHADRDQIAAERAALARVPEMVAALDHASARLAAASARTAAGGSPAQPAATAAALTVDELHRSLDGLRLALDNRQPSSMASVSGILQQGFSELGTRMDRIEGRIDQAQRASVIQRPIRAH